MKQIIFIGFFLLSQQAVAQDIPIQQFIHAFIPTLEKKLSKIQGGAVAIVHQGQVVYKKTFGYQRNREDPITENTLFALASASKPVTSTVVAKLIKEKRLSLEDKVSPCFPCFSSRVRLKHLLSHTSGHLVRSNGEIEKGIKRPELIRAFFTKPIKQVPQQKYYYNNLVYSLTKEVVEKSTGTTWIHAVTQFWQALNSKDFAQCTVPDDVEIASPHAIISGEMRVVARVPRNYPQSVCSSAGSFASINTLVEFLRLHLGYHPEVLTLEDLAAFHTPQTRAPDCLCWPLQWPIPTQKIRSSYGLGWRILELADGSAPQERLVFHSGYLRGVGSFVGFLPGHDVGIVILINQDDDLATQSGIDFWGGLVKALQQI